MPHRVIPPGEVLYPSTAEANIEVLSPQTGDKWLIGSRQTIRWQGCTNVVVYLLRIGSGVPLQTWYQSNGTSLEVDVSGPAGTSYYIRVRDNTDPTDHTAATAASGFFDIVAESVPLLNPEILSVDPAFLVAGSEDEVTIYGSDFGSQGRLVLASTAAPVPLPIVSWTSTSIVFTVPTTVVTGEYVIYLQPLVPLGNEVTWPFNIGNVAPPLPEPTGTTINRLVARVNARLGNIVRWNSLHRTGDGHTRHFYVPDQFVRELPANDPDVFTLTFYDEDGNAVSSEAEPATVDEDGNPVEGDSESTTDWGWFDYVNNWYHFTTAPAANSSFAFDYSFQWWPEKMIRGFVNNALLYLSDDFYVTHVRDYAISGSEYVIDYAGEPAQSIVEVQYGSEGSWVRLVPFRDFRVLRGEGQECLLQVFGSVSGTLRVRASFKPPLFRLATDTLEGLGLPEEIGECIVLYCCWQCLMQFLPPRMNHDQASVTQGAGTPTVRDQQSTPQIYKLLLDMEIDKRRMRAWTARGL